MHSRIGGACAARATNALPNGRSTWAWTSFCMASTCTRSSFLTYSTLSDVCMRDRVGMNHCMCFCGVCHRCTALGGHHSKRLEVESHVCALEPRLDAYGGVHMACACTHTEHCAARNYLPPTASSR